MQTGSQRGGPWSLGALKFLLWSLEPYNFTDLSPEPKDILRGARSPEPGAQHFQV